jgi:hypothetical protein
VAIEAVTPAVWNPVGMSITVTISDQVGVRGEPVPMTLAGVSERTTLRDLIRTRVRDEVARHNAGPTDVFRGLVMPDGAKPTARGYVMPRRRTINWERQADVAVDAFGRNAFFVLVDDRQVTGLDEELQLDADSDIRFVRLVPLAGG